MKAVEISSYGPPGVLRLGDRPAPVPGAGELLIRVTASGINRPDVLQRTGNYPVPSGASDIPGLEVAGEVVDVNNALKDKPETVNTDPHGNWMIVIRMSNPADAGSLLDARQYEELVK